MTFIHTLRSGTARGLTLAAIGLAALTLAGCEEGAQLFEPKEESGASSPGPSSTKLVERDVEAPEIFSVTEAGLWDGRPSFGGIWAAHPTVDEPGRVIIRNQANNKFVIGALFRRETEIPGPRIQVSSDAAEALGMLAGQPVELNVTALVREEVIDEPPVEAELAESAEVEEAPLEPIAAAGAAIAAAEAKKAEPAASSEVAPKPASTKLDKPYIQIGIFSVEANANNAAAQMRNAGMVPLIKKTTSKNKTFWRVLVGPAATKSERSSLIKNIHATGFSDAYAVSN